MSEPPARDLGLLVSSRIDAPLCLMGFPPICATLVTRVSGWYRGRDRVQARRTCAGGLLKKGAAIIALAGALFRRPRPDGPPVSGGGHPCYTLRDY